MDVEALRADTPGTAHRIHLNNAGAGLMPRPVVEAIKEHIDLESRVGGYEAAAERQEQIGAAYRAVADLVGAHPSNIAMQENATAAFNAALSAVPFAPGDVILTTRNDYVSNQIAFLSLQQRMGIRVERAPDAPEGGVDVEAFGKLAHRLGPRLATITHVPTNSGMIQPVVDIARACADRGVPLLVDACQSVGQLDVDVAELGCDFLSATGRKFLRGPRGVGFLYVSDQALERGWEPLFPDLRGADWIDPDLYQPRPDAARFENWEFAYALVLGLGAAARYALDLGLPAIEQQVLHLGKALRERCAALPGVTVLDRGQRVGAIVTLHLAGHDPLAVMELLRTRGINTGYATREAAVLDFDDKGVDGALRVSPHYYNTLDEIDRFVDAIADL